MDKLQKKMEIEIEEALCIGKSGTDLMVRLFFIYYLISLFMSPHMKTLNLITKYMLSPNIWILNIIYDFFLYISIEVFLTFRAKANTQVLRPDIVKKYFFLSEKSLVFFLNLI